MTPARVTRWADPSQRWQVWARWLTLYLVVTLLVGRVAGQPEVRVAHGILIYLLLIIGASREGGRALSIVMVLLCYVTIDWLFVPPLYQFGSTRELDWLILVGFATAGLLVSQLFVNLQRAARLARERTIEVERLSLERLQLEREASAARVLVEADRLKNALLNSVAHDLRSPVATLALLSDPASGFASADALERVSGEARRLGEFLVTLQRFAKAGEAPALQLESHDADLVLQTALRSSAGLLVTRIVRLPASSQRVTVSCDATLVNQVLGNLLQNATRYAPPDQPIDLLVREGATTVDLVVADRGPGLPPDQVDRIFAPLRRPVRSDGASPVNTHMGMGLSIARTFARAQGGDVLYQPREGGGSEFILRLQRGPS
ncbi:ATP-binding protein [Gemmatimonas aurantiaca]|uniref:sensor histidine kinase n=1 Tax=Gemmatimonas aurantiaca TaxID=173480 RepID=UPI00301BAE45